MHQAMLEHNYDLQYLLYTCALHIYLQQRIQDYQYDSHIGGIFYTFIRGINAENNPESKAGLYFKRPPFSIIKRLADCFETGTIADALSARSSQFAPEQS